MAFAFKKSVFDGANVDYDDPTIDINPKAFKMSRVDPNNNRQYDENGSDDYNGHGQYSEDADENAENDVTYVRKPLSSCYL